MGITIPCLWSDRLRLHEPGGEVWVGVRTPGAELPERAERIRAALEGAGAALAEAAEHGDEALLAVHDPALVAYLRTAWADWSAAGLPEDPGQDRVVPYVFAHPGLLGGIEARVPAAAAARAGLFAYDTMTFVGPGTWEAARGAIDAALSAADLVADGERAAYALCRPPGHHAAAGAFGGSCYLNNAAAAAARLRRRLGEVDGLVAAGGAEAGGGATVAVIDIDAHHGNGTQSIFYGDAGVLTGSVHVDPGAGWFPHFLGFEDEEGAGAGRGANRNLPLEPGAGDDGWLAAVAGLAEWVAPRAEALVVALGVDAAASDPEAPLEVTAAGYRAAGRVLGGLSLPTVVVQEGGYDLESIGTLVVEFLEGLQEG